MKLTKPIAFIDIETTGLDIVNDRILEIGIFRLNIDGTSTTFERRFHPGRHIPEASTAIHGIKDEDVRDCAMLNAYAEIIKNILSGCDIAGFNSNCFDIPFLVEQFLKLDVKLFDDDVCFIDVGNLFKIKEQRTLIAAVNFYLNKDHADAHSALADAVATSEVFDAQLSKYGDISELSMTELAKFSNYGNDRVDFAGKLVKNEKGEVCYNFGKSKGVKVIDDPGFGEWMLDKDFTLDTKSWISSILYAEAKPSFDDLFDDERENL